MENNLTIFFSDDFGQVRTVCINGEPWFAAADVCRALDIRNSSMATERLDADEKMTLKLSESHKAQRGGAQKLNFVNEPGLYTLIFGSRKLEARAFRKWIVSEVIPSIRKNGGYLTDTLLQQIKESPEILYQFAEFLLKERDENARLQDEITNMKPKADFFDIFINTETCTNIRNTAKELRIPERRLIKFLLENGLLYRSPSGELLPYKNAKNDEFFRVKDFMKNGHVGVYTLITPNGKNYIRQLAETAGLMKS